MFKSKTAGHPQKVDTLLGVNANLEGNIHSLGTVRVDGKVKGDLIIEGDVYIGESSVVTGNIHADNIYISGTVEGNIRTAGMLKLLSTAKLYGDIEIASFVSDEGGIFQGKCCMVTDNNISPESPAGTSSKKNPTGKDYKKSTLLDQIYEEKERKNEMLG